MSFKERLGVCVSAIEDHLDARLNELPASELTRAMRYAVTGGGKRLRGFLVLESAALHDIRVVDAIGAAAAIEAIHAYSLVHDDMPCMDDDDLRRGKPTVHKVWDEAMAVLAGDALQSFAFELVCEGELPEERRLELSKTLAVASGASGMAYGQALDIAAETAGTPLSLEQMAGARMAGADAAPLQRYARALGLAFQIADDILDVEGDEAKTGKRLHKDAEAGKATFVSHLGLDGAKARARELVESAIDAVSLYSAQAVYLKEAARFVVSRDT